MKSAIVLHLYYVDLWDEFKNKLVDLTIDFDLYVSLCIDNVDISDKIMMDFPKAKIFHLPNKGTDIGPFIIMLQYLIANNKKYNYIIKMHGKKSIHGGKDYGSIWRTELVDGLIGSDNTLKSVLNYMENNKECKIAFPEKYAKYEEDCDWMQPILSSLDIDEDKIDRCFSAGTMFIVQCEYFINIFKKINLNQLYNEMNVEYTLDHRIEHVMERVFCFMCQTSGNKILLID